MTKDINYYISKGFDQKTAEYFATGRKTIIKVEPLEDFSLKLWFDNSEIRILDLKPTIQKGKIFEPFNDFQNFKRVYLDDTNNISWDIDPNIDSNIVWNNKVDICSDSCYIDSVLISNL